jgi:outer membrane protein TolC
MRSHFFGIYLALLAAGTTAAAPSALTLAEAQRIATQRSRQLVAIDASAAAARDMAVAAGRRADPVLSAGVDNLPVGGPERFSLNQDFMTMRRIGVTQELTRADKRHWRAEAYLRSAGRADAEKAAAAAAIERDTALAWLDTYFATAASALVAEQAVQAGLEIEAAETAYRGGRGSQAEVLAARAAKAMADDSASQAARRARSARIALSRWVGEQADQPLAALPAFDATGLDPARLEAQLAHHPLIAAMARAEDAAQAAVKLAEADRKSDWSVELAFQQRGPVFANMVSVGLSVPLQWDRKNKQDRELSARLSMADQARAEREEAERAHLAEVRTLIDEWTSGRERLARFEREIVPLATSRSEAVLAAYRGMKASLADVLAARRGATQARLQELELQAETARAWARLNYLTPRTGTQQ